jgi:hypothetical protein
VSAVVILGAVVILSAANELRVGRTAADSSSPRFSECQGVVLSMTGLRLQNDMGFSLGMTAGFTLGMTAGTIKKLPRMPVPVEKIVIAAV